MGRGEIDLLMRHDGFPVAVEVKSRVAAEPLGEFTAEKRDAVAAAARRLRPPVRRIDLVTVRFGRSGALIRWLRGV